MIVTKNNNYGIYEDTIKNLKLIDIKNIKDKYLDNCIIFR